LGYSKLTITLETMRLVQHKKEAFWFYRFLSIFYDKYVNPLFWTEPMRDKALELAELNDPNLKVVDVGSGTGFNTQGVVKKIPAANVTCLDQSPHQMAKAKKKPDLQGCEFLLGDAENLPFETDHFDRYVSAGSIEYWPNPQAGINESYRVIKPGGIAVNIGPLEPQNPLGRFLANTWMLFPREEEYRKWFQNAGFHDIKVQYIRPHWYRGSSEYGLAISGVKPVAGESPQPAPPLPDPPKMTIGRSLVLFVRVLVGSLAGFFFIPAALLAHLRGGGDPETQVPLNRHQIFALILLGIVLGVIIWLILGAL
jgi:MPBQ/MSBQ methyltransferase